jgi:hypothetical protein
MNGEKTFFLGIGAAKSGTSWIYDYLSSHPEVCPGPIKEMHVLNSPGNQGILKAVQQLPWHRFAGRKWLTEILWKAYYRADWDRYFKAYGKALQNCKVTGEISTSYLSIDVETLNFVQKRFMQSGVRTVGILVLRDPIEQLISSLKFKKRLSRENRYQVKMEVPIDQMFVEAIEHITQAQADNYQSALSVITSAFEEEARFLELYENLFNEDSLNRLCDRLHIARLPGNFAKRVNESITTETVSLSHIGAARTLFDPAYRAAARFFGEDHLQAHWRYYGNVDF